MLSVAQSCLILCDPMNCNPPGFSVHGISQARTQVDCHFLLQGIFPTQLSNPLLLRVSCIPRFFTTDPSREAKNPGRVKLRFMF